jgi:hypothetical protein
MSVPTWQQLIEDLRIPEVENKLDRLGRKIQKNNYFNISKGKKIFYKPVSMAEVNRVRGRLYSR